MEISNLIPHVESLIFASEKPLTSLELTDLINNAFGFMEDKITLDQIETSVEAIVEKYQSEFYPFEIRQSGGGWQFLTKKEYHKTVAQLNGEKFLKRLSSASLETLSIIAYKQPVTKAEIEAIRGVSSDYAVQKLLEKDLIVITGRNEALPGHPLVYATSKSFMDYFGINSSDDLPKLKEIFDDSMVSGTPIAAANEASASALDTETETATDDEETLLENASLVVSENGELVIEEVFIESEEEDLMENPEAEAQLEELTENSAAEAEEAAEQLEESAEEEITEEEFTVEEQQEEESSEEDEQPDAGYDDEEKHAE